MKQQSIFLLFISICQLTLAKSAQYVVEVQKSQLSDAVITIQMPKNGASTVISVNVNKAITFVSAQKDEQDAENHLPAWPGKLLNQQVRYSITPFTNVMLRAYKTLVLTVSQADNDFEAKVKINGEEVFPNMRIQPIEPYVS